MGNVSPQAFMYFVLQTIQLYSFRFFIIMMEGEAGMSYLVAGDSEREEGTVKQL